MDLDGKEELGLDCPQLNDTEFIFFGRDQRFLCGV